MFGPYHSQAGFGRGSPSGGFAGPNRIGHLLGTPMGATREAGSPRSEPPHPPASGQGLPHRTTQDDSVPQDVLRPTQVLSGPHTDPESSSPAQADSDSSGFIDFEAQDGTETFDVAWLDQPLPAFLGLVGDWVDSIDWVVPDWALFWFVRAAKSHPELRTLRPGKAYALVRRLLSKHTIEAPDLGGVDLLSEDGEVAFHSTWDKVRFPIGDDPVQVAYTAAGEGRLVTQTERPGRYSRFLTTAALLQLECRRKPILLPIHVLKVHFECQPRTVSSWIGWAVEDRVLLKATPHVYRSGGKGRAAEYVFGLHCWKAETIAALAALIGNRLRPGDQAWTAGIFDGSVQLP